MRFEIRRLHDEYRYTTVYVTHDQSEAMTTSDVIAVMNAGKIEQAGSPEEIYDRPRSEFVARFIGMSNVVKGKALDADTVVGCRARRCACTGGPLKPGADAAVSIRQQNIRLLGDASPTAKDNVVAAKVMRQVFLGSSRDYMVEVADGTQLRVVTAGGRERAARRDGLAAPAAGALPGAAGLSRLGYESARTTWEGNDHGAKLQSRRDVLKGSSALALTVYATPIRAQAPAARYDHAALIEAAKKEGRSSITPRSTWRWRSASPRRSRPSSPASRSRSSAPAPSACSSASARSTPASIHSVDVVNSSDAAHFIVWKRQGILAPHVPEDVAKHYAAEHKDADGMHANFRAGMSVIGYNTNLVKREEAPKSFADLLDPKWMGKMVKAHPGYSGNVMTATFQITRDLGWEYLEKLAKQKVMQVQSSTDPPKKLALGERAVMVDGNEYNALQLKEKGDPIEIVYPTEGTPMAVGPNAIFKAAPNPERRAAVQQLVLHRGVPAAHHRRRLAALAASAGQGEAGPARCSRTSR